jgi:hypothetical protein
MLRQARAKEKKKNTHTSCVNIEIWGAGAGDPHKFRFENLSLSIESCGWSSFNIIRPGGQREKAKHTHTSCVNIEIGGPGAGDPHKFRFGNLSLSIESCGWSSFNIIRPSRNVFR